MILGWTPAALKLKPYQEVVDRLEEAEKIARDLNDEARLARCTGSPMLTSPTASRHAGCRRCSRATSLRKESATNV